jgi:hypothetical protein
LRNKNLEQLFEMEQEIKKYNELLESFKELEESYKLEEVKIRISS